MEFCKQNIIQRDYFKINIVMEADKTFPQLHTNACGDFQLMSRHYWYLLRGYREVDIAASHVDSLLSYASYAAGVQEVFLADPMRIYHIDHDSKFSERLTEFQPQFQKWASSTLRPGRTREKLANLYRKFVGERYRCEIYGIPTLSYLKLRELCSNMIARKRPYIFNDEAWGLGKEKLPESVISRAKWDQTSHRG